MRKIFAVGLSVLLLAQTAFALNFPQPRGFINDFAGIIEYEVEGQLAQTLASFEKETSHEITVVTVESLQEVTIEDFAVELFAEWGIGKKGADNGALLLVAPNEREVRIEVGYGLEPVLTDAKSAQIIQNILLPAFKTGDFSGGISEAVGTMMAVASGEIVDVPPASSQTKFSAEQFIMFLVFFYAFVYGPTAHLRKSKWKTKFIYRTFTSIWFTALFAIGTFALIMGIFAGIFLIGFLLDLLFWKFFRNTPDDKMPFWIFMGRGGRGGGFGGGGFGGFGGGFSGGGGASGRW